MQSRSLISLRTVVDGVQSLGGIQNFPFTKELFASVKSARSRYRQYLEETQSNEKKIAEKRKASDEKQELTAKCSKLRKVITSMEKDADSLSLEAEVKSCFTILAKANALRKGISEKKKELSLSEAKLKDL